MGEVMFCKSFMKWVSRAGNDGLQHVVIETFLDQVYDKFKKEGLLIIDVRQV